MPLIKNDAVVSDPWLAASDDAPLPGSRPVLVSLARWQAEREQLAGRNAGVGVRLDSHQGPEEIAADLGRLALVALSFPLFGDGRAYSAARLLRTRYGFGGEVRAVGAVLPDQIPLMRRCGFDAFEVGEAVRLETVAERLHDYRGPWYQAGAEGGDTVADLRRRRAGRPSSFPESAADRLRRAAELDSLFGGLPAEDLVAQVVNREFRGRIAYVSSFGTEAAILLHMVAEADPATPVLFIDTGKLFAETVAYRDVLIERLGLSDVRTLTPNPHALAASDADGDLCLSDPDVCCGLRKVEPLERGLAGFTAWINGRKGYHGASRERLPAFEVDGGRIKVNPLRTWTKTEVDAYFAAHRLPRHPLERHGYASIGCAPCTDRVKPGEDARAGRWRGRVKTECGIHGRAS